MYICTSISTHIQIRLGVLPKKKPARKGAVAYQDPAQVGGLDVVVALSLRVSRHGLLAQSRADECSLRCVGDMHAYIHACMHACMHTYIHACIHTHIHPSIHSFIHACMHTQRHLHAESQADERSLRGVGAQHHKKESGVARRGDVCPHTLEKTRGRRPPCPSLVVEGLVCLLATYQWSLQHVYVYIYVYIHPARAWLSRASCACPRPISGLYNMYMYICT